MNLKKRMFITIVILSLILGFSAYAKDTDNELEKIKTQIHILNLLNGLELNNQQEQLILYMARRAEDIRLEAKEEIAQKEEEITNAYEEVLRVAERGSLVIPEDVAFRFHKITQEIDKIKEAAKEKLTALAIKIKDNLQPHQLYVLDNYQPCIIPPVKEGRIGQADDPGGFANALERVHSLPEDRYNLKKEEITQRAIDRVKAKVPPGFIIDEENLKTQLLNAMDEVRAISDVDFAIKKEEIAQNIKARLLPAKPPVNIGVKIEHLLLQPEIIPILEKVLTNKQN